MATGNNPASATAAAGPNREPRIWIPPALASFVGRGRGRGRATTEQQAALQTMTWGQRAARSRAAEVLRLQQEQAEIERQQATGQRPFRPRNPRFVTRNLSYCPCANCNSKNG